MRARVMLVAAVALAGCGSGSSPPPPVPQSSTTPSAAASSAAPSVAASASAGHRRAHGRHTAAHHAAPHFTPPPHPPAGPGAPANFSIGPGGILFPPINAVPAGIPIMLTVMSQDPSVHTFSIHGHTLKVGPGPPVVKRLPPLAKGTYPIKVDGTKRGKLRALG